MSTQDRAPAPAARRPVPGAPNDADHRPARRSGMDRGSVTAELAVGLPALVLLLLAGLTAVLVVLAKLECVDAAREAARAAARGDSGVTAGGRVAPHGATVSVGPDGDLVRVTVRTAVRPLGGHLPGFTVSATAVAQPEPGVAP